MNAAIENWDGTTKRNKEGRKFWKKTKFRGKIIIIKKLRDKDNDWYIYHIDLTTKAGKKKYLRGVGARK